MSSDENKSKIDISNLQENFSKQQKKICALKELVRKSEVAHGKSTSSAQEKVKNIAQRLTNLKSKAHFRKTLEATSVQNEMAVFSNVLESDNITDTLNLTYSQTQMSPGNLSPEMSSTLNSLQPNQNEHSSKNTVSSNLHSTHSTQHVTHGSEKIQMMRQQMEENKMRMAQRVSSKQHLELLVTQLKEKFDSTQQSLEDTCDLGRSMTDLSALAYTPVTRERHKSATDLSTQTFNLERERMKFFENRCRLLEKQLEKEKQAHSNALNDSQCTKKLFKELEEKLIELELENQRLKQEFKEIKANDSKQEELSVNVDNDLAAENVFLKHEIAEQFKHIGYLEGIKNRLETASSELTVKNSEYQVQVQELEENLRLAEFKLKNTQRSLKESELQCSSLQETLNKFQNCAETVGQNILAPQNTDIQIKEEMIKQIKELQDELQQLKEDNAKLQQFLSENEKLEVSDATVVEKLRTLMTTIESQREDLQKRLEESNRYEDELMEKTIELNVLNANFKVLEEKLQATNKRKPLFTVTAEETASQNPAMKAEIQQLKQKLDEANKAMIKLKLKCKQTEKQIEKLTKTEDLYAEVVLLEKEKEQMQQKIIELEDEKGQWQLQQVEHTDIATKLQLNTNNELNEKFRMQTETIRLLEQQKYEYTKKLEATKTELKDLKQKLDEKDKDDAIRVSSELCEIKLEEKLEEQSKSLANLQAELLEKDAYIAGLRLQLEKLLTEKQIVDNKLEHYLRENMELLERVDKLSKSSSSAESIEIVERLTQQECAEIDEFNKRLEQIEQLKEGVDRSEKTIHSKSANETQTSSVDMGQELSGTLMKLRQESSELMNKIELFTAERREVLKKMEILSLENQELHKKIEELNKEKEKLQTNASLSDDAKTQLELKLQELSKEKQSLVNQQVSHSSAQKAKLSHDITSLQHSSEVVGVLDGVDDSTMFGKCEKSLSKLNLELEAYRKANDKNSKFNASKKLAKEAKNAYTQLSELLQKVKEARNAVETITVVETVVAVTAPNGKALAEYEELTTQNRELKATIEELRRDLQARNLREGRVEESAAQFSAPSRLVTTQGHEVMECMLIRQEFEQCLKEYESQCVDLQITIEELRLQLQEARLASAEKTAEISRLNEDLQEVRKMSENFERLINNKEMVYGKQVQELTNLRRELEAKCEAYEGEVQVFQTHITEQKQQILDLCKENEYEINLKKLDLQQRDEEIMVLQAELMQLKQSNAVTNTYEEHRLNGLQQECEKLHLALKENINLVAEQVTELANKQEVIDTLNQKLIQLYKTNEGNSNKLIANNNEIVRLQELLDENIKTIDTLRKDNNEQKTVVDKLLAELHSNKKNTQHLLQLEAELERLKEEKTDLVATNKCMEQRNKQQLEKLKKFAANLKKRTYQCQEYEAKIKDIEKGTAEMLETKEKQGELQQLRAASTDLFARMKEMETTLEKAQNDTSDLRATIIKKNAQLREAEEKNVNLQAEVHAVQFRLQQKIQEMDKLQKGIIGAQNQTCVRGEDSVEDDRANVHCLRQDLAKATNLQQAESPAADKELHMELQQNLALSAKLREQLTVVSNENTIKEQEHRLHLVNEELKLKSIKFEKSKAIIKDRNNQIQRLQAEVKDLQAKLSVQPEEAIEHIESEIIKHHVSQVTNHSYEVLLHNYDILNQQYQTDKANFEQTIARLETLHEGIQAKLRDEAVYIESLEQEITKYKEKIWKLEKCVSTLETRRGNLEVQMQTRVDEYEKNEDDLVCRLRTLAEQDDVMAQRLLNLEDEKKSLQQYLQQLHSKLQDLQCKNSQLKREQQDFRSEIVGMLENKNTTLREQLAALGQDMQRTSSAYDNKLVAKTKEMDKLESDFNDQLRMLRVEKRSLSEDLERSHDEIVRLKETINSLEQVKTELDRESSWLRMSQENAQQDQYELQELRTQNMQNKSEIDNLRHKIETLVANHEIEMQGLRRQISELDTVRMQVGQNQTDDQVFIETENKRLTDLLTEKEAQIESYQRQNLQLQRATVTATGTPVAQQQPVDKFALTFGLPSNTALSSRNGAEERGAELEQEFVETNEMVARLQRDFNTLQAEFRSLQESNSDLKRQLADKQYEIESMCMQHQQQRSTLSQCQHQANEVIPASIFFASEQLLPSPFDDLVTGRPITTVSLEGSSDQNSLGHEQLTIEDLQRNVSDLEKHAQDLEQKLMLRNHRDGEVEERLREMQQKLSAAEQLIQERDEQTKHMKLAEERQQLQYHETISAAQEKLADLQAKLNIVELQLQERGKEFIALEQQKDLERNLESQIDEQRQNEAEKRLAELERNLDQLQQLIQERDAQIENLQSLNERTQLKVQEESIQSQIASKSTSINDAFAEVSPTLDMFFGDFSAPDSQVASAAVLEEVIAPEKAYLCGSQDALDVVADWGDSWGSDNEAGAVQANFKVVGNVSQQTHSLISHEQKLEIKMQEQAERMHELQLAHERCEQQKEELHQKLGNLMKKLKKYKLKIDELQALNVSAIGFRKSSSIDSNSAFDDLDAAIQEEFKLQITQLEAMVEEQRKQIENQIVEKEKLLKRIEVLTAGNEHMSELKDRQDMDVQMYQLRIRELQEKLNKLEEWSEPEIGANRNEIIISQQMGDGNFMQQQQSQLLQKIAALEAEVKDITDERQELQVLLDEEKSNGSHLEEIMRHLKNQLLALEHAEKCQYNELKLEHQNLQELYREMQEENTRLTKDLHKSKEELQNKQAASIDLELNQQNLREQNEQLQTKLLTKEQELNEVKLQLLELRTHNGELLQQNQEICKAQSLNISHINDLEEQVKLLENEKHQNQSAPTTLQSEISSLRDHTNKCIQSETSVSLHMDELWAQLQEKESEIVHLKQRIEDLIAEDQTEKLVLEILTKNQEIHMLKTQVRNLEMDKQELEHNLMLDHSKAMNEKEIDMDAQAIKEQMQALKKYVQELEDEKQNMEVELGALNTHALSSFELEDKMKAAVLELDTKNIEITELRKTLEKQQTDTALKSKPDASTVDIDMLNAKWESHVEQKCSEIALMWRQHLEQREKDFKAIENKLQEDILVLRAACAAIPIREQTQHVVSTETTATSTDESSTPSGSSSVAPSKSGTPLRRRTHNDNNEANEPDAHLIIERMQTALENQEMEIVTLKEQLAIRSAEYARLAAQYDPFKLQTTLSHSGLNTFSGPSSMESPASHRHASTVESSIVPKSELDLAMYMLHQRDMRCEEMTLELVSLLEERDTLQLKLSNTLRQVEAMKAQYNCAESIPLQTQAESVASNDSINRVPTIAAITNGDPTDELNQKLSQLQSVNHSNDKIIKEERDQRIRQMEKMQQDVAKMPSEALSELIGSDLTQHNQSPSSVLLNWLWGNKPRPTGNS